MRLIDLDSRIGPLYDVARSHHLSHTNILNRIPSPSFTPLCLRVVLFRGAIENLLMLACTSKIGSVR